MADSESEDREQIYADFNEAVNMSPAELEKFLESDDSKAVRSTQTS